MRVIYQNSEGGVSVIVPADCGLTIEEIAAKDVPVGVAFEIVEASEIPQDWTFRNAWKKAGAAIVVDMPKAREIHKDKLRALRAPLLAAADVEYMRADEAGDAAAKLAIASKKSALRDVTKDQAIAAAATPEQLKAVIPDALK